MTHHFYVLSLGESTEIKVQKQCGKTLFGNEEIYLWDRLGTLIRLARSVVKV